MARLTNKVRDLAISAARRYGILPSSLVGLWAILSEFDPLALGSPNKEGAPYTFGLELVDIRTVDKGMDARRLLDPEVNADISSAHLARCINAFEGDVVDGVIAYVHGIDHVKEHGVKGHKAFGDVFMLAADGAVGLDDETVFPTPARTHKIKASESLLTLAVRYYGDSTKYVDIYRANAEVIGTDPSVVKAGTILTIP